MDHFVLALSAIPNSKAMPNDAQIKALKQNKTWILIEHLQRNKHAQLKWLNYKRLLVKIMCICGGEIAESRGVKFRYMSIAEDFSWNGQINRFLQTSKIHVTSR